MSVEGLTRSINLARTEDVPVIIAGGGLIGLSTAMFLAQHGVTSLAIERLRGGSPMPRAAMFGMGTIEMYRRAGIEHDILVQSEKEFVPEGALIMMDCVAGKKIGDIIPVLNAGVAEVSPCRRLFISQPGLEPILRKRAQEVGASLLEGHEIVAFDQDENGVTVTARDVDTGQDKKFRSKYLVGADGAHSRVRELLGIRYDGRGVFSNSITIYFEADLWPWLGDKPISIIYVKNEILSGFFRMSRDCQSGFMVVNTVGDPVKDPHAASNAASDVSEKRLVELLKAGIGRDIPIKVTNVARWRATSDVAERYRQGRVFLAGDFAHLMPPTGGFGGNTGIHDAHNLAWKLAFVLKGLAGPELLSTYEAERKRAGKFTVEQAYSRYVTRTAPYLGAKDYQPVANDFHIELGYLFNSSAVVSEGDEQRDHDDPRQTFGRPGSRAPHVWLERRVSSIDLFDKSFVLLAGQSGSLWCEAARRAARKFDGLPFEAYCVGSDELHDPDNRFEHAYGISASGAVLVRPDGFVAWRAKTMERDPEAAVARALSQLLARDDAAPSARGGAPTVRGFSGGGFVNPYARSVGAADPGHGTDKRVDSMKLYMHPISMTSRPVRLFIAEHGMPVDEQVIDVMTGEHLQPAFAAINPNQMVPVLEDGDLRLTESSAILKYLADKIDSPAYPKDLKKRARVNEVMDWINTNFYRDWAYNLCYPQLFPHHKRRSDEAHAGTIDWGKANSKRWLQLLNGQWIGPHNQFLCGNQITIADYFGAGLVTLGEVIHVDFSKYPNIARWLGNMKKLKNWDPVNEAFYGLVGSTKGGKFETV